MSVQFPPVRNPVVSRREAMAGLAMLAAGGVAAVRKPDITLDYLGKNKLDEILPAQIGNWKFISTSGLIVPPSDQLALAIYSQTITRLYTDGNSVLGLLVAYSASQTGFLQVHRPEFCYRAAGFELSDFALRDVQIDASRSIRVNTLLATREGGGEKLLYWTRIGQHIPVSWAQQKLAAAQENLRRIIPDAALIRVSTPLEGEAAGTAKLEGFVRAMMAAMAPPFRRVLVP
jgi:EpsI family protein